MKRYLILENGNVYEGEAVGADGETIGEVVFTTDMIGYMDTLTDTRYYGQIVTQTFPLIGCYGAITADAPNAKPALKGYIIREACAYGSNYRKETEIDEYLKKNNIVGLANVDTRALTRILRENGVMNGMLSSSNKVNEDLLKRLKAYKVVDAVESTTCLKAVTHNQNGRNHAVLWDLGAAENDLQHLLKRGYKVTRVPASFTATQIASLQPDCLIFSGGAGEVSSNKQIADEMKKLSENKIPTLAIGLGHQLLALSMGAKIKKLKHGHRGVNQPIKDSLNGKVYSTSQNHGYVVSEKSLPSGVAVSYVNVNDGTVEGLIYKSIPAFSVQFIPSENGGPRSTVFVYDRLTDMIDGGKKNA